MLNEKIPGLPAQDISDEEFEKIKWDVAYNVIEPDYPSPSPSDPFYCSKIPVAINSNQGSNLLVQKRVSKVTSIVDIITKTVKRQNCLTN